MSDVGMYCGYVDANEDRFLIRPEPVDVDLLNSLFRPEEVPQDLQVNNAWYGVCLRTGRKWNLIVKFNQSVAGGSDGFISPGGKICGGIFSPMSKKNKLVRWIDESDAFENIYRVGPQLKLVAHDSVD
tara:strand:+ start:1482 stop:1865 length:384 start_codon:yes stop_codon:yes gene_type:complete